MLLYVIVILNFMVIDFFGSFSILTDRDNTNSFIWYTRYVTG